MARMDSIDNYQVLNLVGKGGFASVYKAKYVLPYDEHNAHLHPLNMCNT